MESDIRKENGKLVISVRGKLDTNTAPELEGRIREADSGETSAVLDIDGLDYISSAGLRIVLNLKKTMSSRGGDLVIRGASDDVREIFDMTGFSDIITIE